MAPGTAALRLAFGSADRVAPGWAAVVAGNLWFTPPRRRGGGSLGPPRGADFAVELGATTVRGTVWGESGPCVYFMHGWGGRGTDIAALAPALLDRGLRVVTFDGPAHGRSGPGMAGTRRTHAVELARALGAVIAHHGPAYAVIAHSLGTVALSLGLRSGDLACDRVVLLAPVIEARGQLDAFCRHLGIGGRTRRRLDREISRHTGIALDEFRLLAAGDRVGVQEALVLHDRNDPIAPYAATASHVGEWSAATLVTTEGLGHYRLLRDPSVIRTVADRLALPLGTGGPGGRGHVRGPGS